ncbi:hypothetical protein Q7P37_001086 [Cladosporium fusiforme]
MAPPKMWLKRVLIPLWVVELIIMGIFFILAGILIGAVNSVMDDYRFDEADGAAWLASAGTVMGLSGLTILLTVIEIGSLAAHRLNPSFHLASACIKTTIWTIWFILSAAASAHVGSSSALDVVLSLLVALCAIGQLIYGSIIVHRVRTGFYRNDGHVTYDGGNAYNGRNSHGNYNGEMDAYQPRKDVSSDGRPHHKDEKQEHASSDPSDWSTRSKHSLAADCDLANVRPRFGLRRRPQRFGRPPPARRKRDDFSQ